VHPFPRPDDLDSWVAPAYMSSYRLGTLRDLFRCDRPFPHYVLPEFFRESAFERIRWECDRLEANEGMSSGSERTNLCLIRSSEILRLFYGAAFRGFVNSLIGARVTRSDDHSALLQLRRFRPDQRSISIHTDAESGLDLGMILNLSRSWAPGGGGEMCLYRKKPDGGFELQATIEPRENQLYFVGFSAVSYHCVQPMQGDWIREIIIAGWRVG